MKLFSEVTGFVQNVKKTENGVSFILNTSSKDKNGEYKKDKKGTNMYVPNDKQKIISQLENNNLVKLKVMTDLKTTKNEDGTYSREWALFVNDAEKLEKKIEEEIIEVPERTR